MSDVREKFLLPEPRPLRFFRPSSIPQEQGRTHQDGIGAVQTEMLSRNFGMPIPY